MPSTVNYFAYGSNLHPLRLKQRVPSCRKLRKDSLSGYRLWFHKTGRDGSGKCNAFKTGSLSDRVEGMVYEIAETELSLLDQAEPGYDREWIRLDSFPPDVPVITYFARDEKINDSLAPFGWYHQMVLLGAECNSLPEDYIRQIAATASRDYDKTRFAKETALLQTMKRYNLEKA